jgi:hypothetical protein
MMGLELLESLARRPKAGDLATEMREEIVLRGDGEAVDIHVA